MDEKMDGAVSVGMEFLGVIDSVYTGLVLMPFLVLNEMLSFHSTTFFIPKTDFERIHIWLHALYTEITNPDLDNFDVTSVQIYFFTK